jgi:PadR family transcriptional regulator, regulatory protein PadR
VVRRPSPQTVAVILALAEQPARWRHGYDLCRALELKAGTVYPILIRLADRGLVQTAWEQEPPQGRPARHLYRLSSAGAELAAGLRASGTASATATMSDTAGLRPATGVAGA